MKKNMLFMSMLLSLGLIASDGNEEQVQDATVVDAQDNGAASEGEDTPPPVPPRRTRPGVVVPASVEDQGGRAVAEEEGGEELAVEEENDVADFVENFMEYNSEKISDGWREKFSGLRTKSMKDQANLLVKFAIENELEVGDLRDIAKILMKPETSLSLVEKAQLLLKICHHNLDSSIYEPVSEWLNNEDNDLTVLDRNTSLVELFEMVLPKLKAELSQTGLEKQLHDLEMQIKGVMIDGQEPQEGSRERIFYDKSVAAKNKLLENHSLDIVVRAKEALAVAQKAKEEATPSFWQRWFGGGAAK